MRLVGLLGLAGASGAANGRTSRDEPGRVGQALDTAVASEVKDLAQETARATDEISRRVDAVQNDALGAY